MEPQEAVDETTAKDETKAAETELKTDAVQDEVELEDEDEEANVNSTKEATPPPSPPPTQDKMVADEAEAVVKPSEIAEELTEEEEEANDETNPIQEEPVLSEATSVSETPIADSTPLVLPISVENTTEFSLQDEAVSAIDHLKHTHEEVKLEANELRAHNYYLMKQVINILQETGGQIVTDVDIPPITSNLEPIDTQYASRLEEVSYLHDLYQKKQTDYSSRIARLNEKVVTEDEKAEELRDAYKEFKRKVSRSAINPRTGKPIPAKWILQKEQEEEEIDKEVETARLKNIHFMTQLKKLTQQAKDKDKLADGLHLIDFEQLKIENQTLNEKIEERNDELYKLRKKTTTTVQVLTHVKEKLQFITRINQNLTAEYRNFDEEVARLRDELAITKQRRDKLRAKNGKLKQKEGFVGSDVLVHDFQSRKHRLVQTKRELAELQAQHSTLQQTIKLASKVKTGLHSTTSTSRARTTSRPSRGTPSGAVWSGL